MTPLPSIPDTERSNFALYQMIQRRHHLADAQRGTPDFIERIAAHKREAARLEGILRDRFTGNDRYLPLHVLATRKGVAK